MRRGSVWVLALTLCVSGIAACGDDDEGSSATTTTTTTAPTTTALDDPAAAVDEFCAKTEELDALAQELGDDPANPPSSEDEQYFQDLGGELLQMMMSLQPAAEQMLPGDAARFQECAEIFSGMATAG